VPEKCRDLRDFDGDGRALGGFITSATIENRFPLAACKKIISTGP
jgi:hypothetical protein